MTKQRFRRIMLSGAALLVAAGVVAAFSSATTNPALLARDVYVRPLDPRHSPYIDGNRSLRLPAGRQGRIDVIVRGPWNDSTGSVAVIVRNNTPRPAHHVDVTGVARSVSGRLLATGASQGMLPKSVVKPGEVAIGYVFFSGADLPSNARFELRATNGPSYKRGIDGDLAVLESALAGDRIVGFARNNLSKRVTGPISAYAACFSRAGKLIDTRSDFTDQNSVAPRGRLPFQVETYDTPCPVYLVAVAGWTD